MLESQRLSVQMSETREALNTMPDDAAAEDYNTLTGKYGVLEAKYRAALITEGAAAANAPTPDTSEMREIRAIESRSNLAAFVSEAIHQQPVSGAESEYRSAIMGEHARPGSVPIQMLLSDRELAEWRESQSETRAVTPVASGALSAGSQASIAARIFTRSIAGRLGIPQITVPVGENGYPYLLSSTTVSMQLPSGEQLATAGSFAGETLSPVRLTASFEYRIEDVYRLRGVEESLRNDLRESLQDAMDDQIINGNGTAPNVEGLVEALTSPSDPGAVQTYSDLREVFTDNVDGKFSYGLGDLRVALGTHAYSFLQSVFRGNSSDMSAYQNIASELGEIFVSSRMPAAASNISEIIIHKSAYEGLTGVAPIWSALDLIPDVITGAKKGERSLTAIMLWNYKTVRTDAFEIEKIRSA